MKSNRNFSGKGDAYAADDLLKKATKLEPIKKSGKEKRSIYANLESDDDDIEFLNLKKRDSILDYFDDGLEDQDDDRDQDDEQEDDPDTDEDDFDEENQEQDDLHSRDRY